MNIEEIIRAWKAGVQNEQNKHLPENPIGYPLSDEDLKDVAGEREDAHHMGTAYGCPCYRLYTHSDSGGWGNRYEPSRIAH